ncbi:hypothetical protein BDK92_7289 [Micromonospora pisi]|uniref:HicA-like toxin of HicAB toxin-antitoxin system n=1 Tax=Micromonospora pisi TaxID=589240 RepID=A0A495JUW0_9ACTN|nr:hypothetical protein [Micromonospora pisi]RKR92807.1 hypothetical protein BDK92_7289 [Micromonospora pisi]
MDDSARRKLFAALRRARWTVTEAGSGHWKIHNPDGRLVATAHNSSSDWRGPRNLLRDLRAGGFEWPRPKKTKRKAAHTE